MLWILNFFSKNKLTECVTCVHCSSTFSVAHGSHSNITDHLQTKKHKSETEAASMSAKLTLFFKQNSTGTQSLTVQLQKVHSHTIMSNRISLSVLVTVHQNWLKKYYSKFLCAHTKRKAITLNVLVPMSKDELSTELARTHFITVSVDTSNRKAVKLIPILIQFINPLNGMKVVKCSL